MGSGRLVNFFKNKPLGKVITSIAFGAASAIPGLGAIMPSIKEATVGLSGKGNHDLLAYVSMAVVIGAIILLIMGDSESAKMLLRYK